jgi:thiol-disulfide isomerase/thioredoxin
MRLRLIVDQLAALALACAAVGCAGERGAEGVKVGSRVPSFSLTTATRETITDRSLEGRVVLLHFWSPGCGPCVREMPDLQKLEESEAATVVGVALEESGWRSVKPFLKRHHVTYRVALGDEEMFDRFGGIGIPYSLLLDRSMRVVKVYRGPVTREALEEDIRAIGSGA